MWCREAAADWGLQCMRYEIRDISPPAGVRSAMELQVNPSLHNLPKRREMKRKEKNRKEKQSKEKQRKDKIRQAKTSGQALHQDPLSSEVA